MTAAVGVQVAVETLGPVQEGGESGAVQVVGLRRDQAACARVDVRRLLIQARQRRGPGGPGLPTAEQAAVQEFQKLAWFTSELKQLYN